MKKAFVCKMVTKKKHLHVMDETFTHGRLIIPMYVIYKVHTHRDDNSGWSGPIRSKPAKPVNI